MKNKKVVVSIIIFVFCCGFFYYQNTEHKYRGRFSDWKRVSCSIYKHTDRKSFEVHTSKFKILKEHKDYWVVHRILEETSSKGTTVVVDQVVQISKKGNVFRIMKFKLNQRGEKEIIPFQKDWREFKTGDPFDEDDNTKKSLWQLIKEKIKSRKDIVFYFVHFYNNEGILIGTSSTIQEEGKISLEDILDPD